jgi:hypothetical protein
MQLKRALTMAAATATAMIGVVLIAPSVASAHHPEIEAKAACDPATGTYVVSWESYSWNGSTAASKTNSNIQVKWTGSATGTANGEYTSTNGYKFSGSFEVPGSTSGNIYFTAKALASWGNGTPPGDSRSTKVTLDGSCTKDTEPATPNASYDCVENQIVITGADDTNSVDYTVEIITAPNGEGTPWAVKITATPQPGYQFPDNTTTMWEFNGTVDCDDTTSEERREGS